VLIKQWLKAGYVEEEMLHPTEAGGTAGAGLIRPLLLNVALHGMEQALGISSTPKGVRRGTYALVRYADDLAIFSPTHEKAIEAQGILSTWLGTRGLRLSGEKTHIRHLREGFNFLGFNIRHYPTPNSSRSGYKLLIKPSPDSITQVKRKAQRALAQARRVTRRGLINEMNPVIRGLEQLLRNRGSQGGVCSLGSLYVRTRSALHETASPEKIGWWRTQKYWGRASGRQDRWVFQDKERHGTLRKFAWTKIIRHRLVPTTHSPDDATLRDYWRQRRHRTQATAGRAGQLARRQHGLCPGCHQALDNGEEFTRAPRDAQAPRRHGGSRESTASASELPPSDSQHQCASWGT